MSLPAFATAAALAARCLTTPAPCACTSPPPSVLEARGQSDHVVIGRVVRREAVHGTLDDTVATPGARRWTGQVVTVAVERGYWGVPTDTLRLLVLAPCDADLVAAEGMADSADAAKGARFLVYAIRGGPVAGAHVHLVRPPGAPPDESPELPLEALERAEACGRTRPFADAAADLRALGPSRWRSR